jgi:hypothetical protein
LVISTDEDVDGEEFGMIDQAVFAGIQEYSVRHGIQDASLSEQRKAKRPNNDMDESTGELEKAVKEYEEYDEYDEDFRDFDKAEADWDDKEVVPKGKGQIKDPGKAEVLKNESQTHMLIANGEDPDTSDDEDLDATFEEEDSDDVSGSEDSDDNSSDSDSDSDSEPESNDDSGEEGDEDEDEDEE